MQTSKQRQSSSGFHGPYHHQPAQEVQPYRLPQFQILDGKGNVCVSVSNLASSGSSKNSAEQFFTLESSTATGTGDCAATYDSPSVSVSSSRSPFTHYSPDNFYGSPTSGSSVVDDDMDFRHKLREIEISLELDITESSSGCCFNSAFRQADYVSSQRWNQIVQMVPRLDLKELLVFCAKAVEEIEAEADSSIAVGLMDVLERRVSIVGEPMERLGAYMLEGLRARLECSGSKIYKSLRCVEPSSSELMSYMTILYNVCPYWKFAYMSANAVIREVVGDEPRIHIIDFQIAQGSQWVFLMHALAGRQGGPPLLRITGVDDSQSAHARGGGLSIVGQRLAKVAQSLNLPFEFHDAAMCGSEVEVQNLAILPGFSLVVNFPYVLHHMPDESVTERNHRDRLLRLVKSLSPRIVTLVEQESKTNTAPFFQRFTETLDYYKAMFESIDAACGRGDKQRISAEQHCVARDIVNMIACEGGERVERHELFTKWRARLVMAGFSPYPLSAQVAGAVSDVLKDYDKRYRVEELNGALYLGWRDRAMSTTSAWR